LKRRNQNVESRTLPSRPLRARGLKLRLRDPLGKPPLSRPLRARGLKLKANGTLLYRRARRAPCGRVD